MYEKTYSKLVEIMVDELGIEPEEIKAESLLVSDLNVNSLEFMNVVMVVEEIFDIILDENRLVKLKTVDDVVNYIIELKD